MKKDVTTSESLGTTLTGPRSVKLEPRTEGRVCCRSDGQDAPHSGKAWAPRPFQTRNPKQHKHEKPLPRMVRPTAEQRRRRGSREHRRRGTPAAEGTGRHEGRASLLEPRSPQPWSRCLQSVEGKSISQTLCSPKTILLTEREIQTFPVKQSGGRHWRGRVTAGCPEALQEYACAPSLLQKTCGCWNTVITVLLGLSVRRFYLFCYTGI